MMTNIEIEAQRVFAEVTRYPLDILDLDADLEDDLGIDSVKLGEVFAVMREKYSLPEKLDIPREELRTIGSIAKALNAYLPQQAPPRQAEPVRAGFSAGYGDNGAGAAVAFAPALLPGPAEAELVERIVNVFAEVTRYPREILDPQASLEDDLGIDSVKLGEVFSVLREQYGLPAKMDIPRESLTDISGIATALRAYLSAPQAAATQAATPASDGAAPHSEPSVANHTSGNGARVQPVATAHSAPAANVLESEAAALYLNESPNVKPFAGKVAFVSGSGRGLGRDISIYLAQLGASVVINSFHSRARGEQTADEIRDHGGDAIHVWGSMANPEQVAKVFDEIEGHYGCLDFFVGNASNGMLARLEDITVEHWEKAYRTNVIGLHQSALRAVSLMRRRGGGKIITLSSPAAHGYVDYFGCMGTVKAAVESLTRSMAIEFAPYNIQVNCVSPGPVYGELLKKWPDSDRLIRQWEDNTVYGRLCEARDVSHFIAYLLSEPVKLFTGSVLVMDGGISSQGW